MNSNLERNNNMKIKQEKEIVKLMIMKYCKGHKHLNPPCKDCDELVKYMEERVELCPFMETKTYCSNCKVHCYRPDMREKIKIIMRYSGPRMIFSNPIIVIDHLYQGIRHSFMRRSE